MPAVSPIHVEKELVVLNKLGLHARPAAEFVRTVRRFHCGVWLVAKAKRYDGGRLMDLLMANLDQGTRFTLIAEGRDAPEAVARLEVLLTEFRDAEAKES